MNVINALSPQTCNIMLISKSTIDYCDQVEPWFRIKYGQFGECMSGGQTLGS